MDVQERRFSRPTSWKTARRKMQPAATTASMVLQAWTRAHSTTRPTPASHSTRLEATRSPHLLRRRAKHPDLPSLLPPRSTSHRRKKRRRKSQQADPTRRLQLDPSQSRPSSAPQKHAQHLPRELPMSHPRHYEPSPSRQANHPTLCRLNRPRRPSFPMAAHHDVQLKQHVSPSRTTTSPIET